MKSYTYKIIKASGGVACTGSQKARSMEHAQSLVMRNQNIKVEIPEGGDYFDSSYFMEGKKVFISISCMPTDWIKPNRRLMLEKEGKDIITLEYKEYQDLEYDRKQLNYLKDDLDHGETVRFCLDIGETSGVLKKSG